MFSVKTARDSNPRTPIPLSYEPTLELRWPPQPGISSQHRRRLKWWLLCFEGWRSDSDVKKNAFEASPEVGIATGCHPGSRLGPTNFRPENSVADGNKFKARARIFSILVRLQRRIELQHIPRRPFLVNFEPEFNRLETLQEKWQKWDLHRIGFLPDLLVTVQWSPGQPSPENPAVPSHRLHRLFAASREFFGLPVQVFDAKPASPVLVAPPISSGLARKLHLSVLSRHDDHISGGRHPGVSGQPVHQLQVPEQFFGFRFRNFQPSKVGCF